MQLRLIRTVRAWASGLSLRQQFAIGAGVLCLVLVTTFATVTALLSHRTADEIVRGDMVELADTMLDKLNRGMFERYRELQILAELHAVGDIWRMQPDKARAALERIQSSLSDYAWIGLAHPDGTVHAATQDVLTGTSVARHLWFRRGFQGPAIVDVHDRSPLIDALQQGLGPIQLVGISVPVRQPDGTISGILGAHIHWRWADELRREFLTAKDGTASTDIWVLARDGQALLGSRSGQPVFSRERIAEMHATRSGAFVDQQNGRSVLTGYAVDRGYRDYPGLGWIVVARRAADAAFAPARSLVLTLVALGVATAAIAIGLAVMLGRRIAAPIQLLTAAAGQLGRDPSLTTLPRQRGSTEVIELSQALRSLLRRIGFAERRAREVETHAEEEARRLSDNIDALRQLAQSDTLTGLLNRRAILQFAEQAMRNTGPDGITVAVIMADIDHFKSINDRYGHAAGDAAIRATGQTIAGSVRGSDKVARFGGEEFIVLLDGISESELAEMAERIRQAVEATPVLHGEQQIAITVSCGAAVLDGEDGIEALIERADLALYRAKNDGRNQVRLAGAAAA
jgi:diguanylate cyclase (GGDEF)-like protein